MKGATRREAAVARLRVIGGRADERLASFIASDAPSSGRTAALRALEGREEARARQIARAACDDTDPDVAIAAIAVLRGWVARESGTEVLDVLSGVALDPRREAGVRLAALDALSELPARHRASAVAAHAAVAETRRGRGEKRSTTHWR